MEVAVEDCRINGWDIRKRVVVDPLASARLVEARLVEARLAEARLAEARLVEDSLGEVSLVEVVGVAVVPLAAGFRHHPGPQEAAQASRSFAGLSLLGMRSLE